MKNFFIFIIGMVTAFFIILYIDVAETKYPGLTFLEEEGECISNAKKIKIFQTIKPNMALAFTRMFNMDETFVLIVGDDNSKFYDEQIITVPDNMCTKQIGTYQYETKEGILKTVPAVEIK